MGAKQSSCEARPGSCVGGLPTYQTVRLVQRDLLSLIVPETTLEAWQLGTGDSVVLRDRSGNNFKCIVQNNGSTYSLGSGWVELVKQFGCRCGDQVLFKLKGKNTWKVRVFSGTDDSEKFTHNGAVTTHHSTSCSSTGTYHAENSLADDTGAFIYAGRSDDGLEGTLGSRSRPIDIDGPASRIVAYNAPGKVIDNAKVDIIEKVFRTYGPRIPLYYTQFCALNRVTGFFQMCSEYGRKFVIPLFEEIGYPEEVSLYLNGTDEPFRCRLAAFSADGTVAIFDGLDLFLTRHIFEEGAAVIIRFDFSFDGDKIYVHRV